MLLQQENIVTPVPLNDTGLTNNVPTNFSTNKKSFYIHNPKLITNGVIQYTRKQKLQKGYVVPRIGLNRTQHGCAYWLSSSLTYMKDYHLLINIISRLSRSLNNVKLTYVIRCI